MCVYVCCKREREREREKERERERKRERKTERKRDREGERDREYVCPRARKGLGLEETHQLCEYPAAMAVAVGRVISAWPLWK